MAMVPANLNGEGISTPRWGLGKTRGNRDVSFYKRQQERVVDSEGRMNALFQQSANRQMHSFCMSQGWLGGACPWYPLSMHSCNFSGDGCFAEVYIVLPRDKRAEYLGGPSFAFSGVITLGVGPSVALKFHHGSKLDLHNELKSPSRDENLWTCRFKEYPVSLGYRCFTFLLQGFCAWGPSIKERGLGGGVFPQAAFLQGHFLSLCCLWFHYLSCHFYAYKVLLHPKTKLSFNFGYF